MRRNPSPSSADKWKSVWRRRQFLLSKGDSIRFYADVPHGYRNPGTEPAELSMLIFYHN
ncbi:MAG: cupin domain-containing protein [Dysosmobacter sp.]